VAVVSDVQVVDQAAPVRVFVQDDVHEAGEAPVVLGQDGHAMRRCGQPGRPDRLPVGVHVAVDEGVGERPAVMAAPAGGVQGGHLLGVVGDSETKTRLCRIVLRHAAAR
jgi:hypothetical protein